MISFRGWRILVTACWHFSAIKCMLSVMHYAYGWSADRFFSRLGAKYARETHLWERSPPIGGALWTRPVLALRSISGLLPAQSRVHGAEFIAPKVPASEDLAKRGQTFW